jgi:drug/metabolite transporter (DMT)-like permease
VARADIAALLALAAAVFVAAGDVLHQRRAQQAGEHHDSYLTLALRLLRDRGWWVGSAVSAVGFALQAAALGLGSVLLVQALLVTALLFALPLNAWAAHRRVSRSEWVWAVLLAASVAVIITVGNPTAGHARAPWETWTVVVAVLLPVLLVCAAAGSRADGPVAAVLLGLVSGALWGVFAVLTKGVVSRLGDGLWAVLGSPELYVWAVVAVGGTAYQQFSFRAGSLTASLPTMTIAEPVVASVLGVVVLGESLRPGDSGWFALVVAAAVMVVATAALARGEAADSDG